MSSGRRRANSRPHHGGTPGRTDGENPATASARAPGAGARRGVAPNSRAHPVADPGRTYRRSRATPSARAPRAHDQRRACPNSRTIPCKYQQLPRHQRHERAPTPPGRPPRACRAAGDGQTPDLTTGAHRDGQTGRTQLPPRQGLQGQVLAGEWRPTPVLTPWRTQDERTEDPEPPPRQGLHGHMTNKERKPRKRTKTRKSYKSGRKVHIRKITKKSRV